MAIDEKKTDTTKEEEQVDVNATKDEGADNANDSKDDADTKNNDNTPDYKAIALEEKSKREKAEKALAEKEFKARDFKRKEKEIMEDDVEEDEDKPITSKQLQRILDENTQRTEKRLMGSRIKEIADSIADSPDEVEAILEIHNNRNFPSYLSLQEQVEEAHAIVNRKKLVSTNSELKRALRSKGTASNDSAGTHRDPMEGTAPRISASDNASYKKAGFTFDIKEKTWKKKLPNGKFLIKDSKSKSTYISP